MVGYFSESTTSGCHSTCVLSEKEPRIEKNGSGECVKVSFDIRNICVVFAIGGVVRRRRGSHRRSKILE